MCHNNGLWWYPVFRCAAYGLRSLDEHSLYGKHRGIRNPHPSYGSWEGHQRKYLEEQHVLKGYIVEAILKGCEKYISAQAREWSSKPVPSNPNRGEANSAGYMR